MLPDGVLDMSLFLDFDGANFLSAAVVRVRFKMLLEAEKVLMFSSVPQLQNLRRLPASPSGPNVARRATKKTSRPNCLKKLLVVKNIMMSDTPRETPAPVKIDID